MICIHVNCVGTDKTLLTFSMLMAKSADDRFFSIKQNLAVQLNDLLWRQSD